MGANAQVNAFSEGVKCSFCGEQLSRTSLKRLAMGDQDLSFTLEEKMFQQANWWLAGEDEGSHECNVIAAL